MKKLIFAFLMLCLPVRAATYYVSKTANGANASNGTNCSTTDSAATNKLTIRWGLSCASAGDTVSIHTGTYAEDINPSLYTLPFGTSDSARITLTAFTGEAVNLNHIILQDNVNISVVAYWLITNLKFLDFYAGGNTHHIRVTNCEITGGVFNLVQWVTATYMEFLNNNVHDAPVTFDNGATTGHYGFYTGGNHNLFDGNIVHDNTGYGFHIFHSGFNNVSDNILRNNVVYNNATDDGARNQGMSGILIASGGNNLVYNNLVYNNRSSLHQSAILIAFLNGATNNQIYNNTIYNNTGRGIEIQSTAGGTVIRNNIIYGNDSGILNNGTGSVFSNNLAGVAGTGIAVVGNPLFVSTVTPDFHIQSSSPAKDAGITIASVVTDKDGFARPQGSAYDIGAYEFISAVPPPVSTISLTHPNGNENLVVGTPVNITWTSNDTHTISLELSRDGGVTYPELIVTGVTQTADSNNSYSWTPTAPQSAFLSKIRITNLFDLVSDDSNSIFSIHGHLVK